MNRLCRFSLRHITVVISVARWLDGLSRCARCAPLPPAANGGYDVCGRAALAALPPLIDVVRVQ
jgi:hypothetical protein